MSISITWEAVISLLAIFTALAGVWWKLHIRIICGERELQNYKLEVAEKYASVSHLQDVEERLVKSIDGLTFRIDKLINVMTANSTKK